MYRTHRTIWIVSVALASVGLFAASAAADDWDTCKKSTGDEAIAACGNAITSGKLQGADLVTAVGKRGNAYFANGDLDRAIADYSEAIRLDPKSALAFNNRGFAYFSKGDVDHSVADYSDAIRLDPKYILAFNNRGRAYSLKLSLIHILKGRTSSR